MRRIATLAVATASALALAACSTVRDPQVTLPVAFEAPASVQSASIPLDTWWTAFGDAQLTALIETALERSPDARTALAQLEEARALRGSQRAQLYIPGANLTGNASRRQQEAVAGTIIDFPGFRNSGASESYGLNIDVSWELDLYGRRRAANLAADGDFAAARFTFEGARASLAANVAQSYFEARGLAIQLEDAKATAALQGQLYTLADKRGQAGLVATSEGDRIAGDLAQANAQVAALQAQLQAAKRTLLILTGRGVEPTASLPIDATVGLAPSAPATVPGDILARRPDVRQAQAQVQSAAGRLRVADLARFPTFNITPGVGISKSVQPGFSSTTQFWSIGGGLTVPILDQVRLAQEIKVADAQAERAVIAYERAVQTAYGEAENALVQLEADQRRVALLRDGEARARRAYDAGRKGYDIGVTDLTNALSTEQAWRGARSAYTAAQVQALTRAVQAYKALGGGWSPSNPASDTATSR